MGKWQIKTVSMSLLTIRMFNMIQRRQQKAMQKWEKIIKPFCSIHNCRCLFDTEKKKCNNDKQWEVEAKCFIK